MMHLPSVSQLIHASTTQRHASHMSEGHLSIVMDHHYETNTYTESQKIVSVESKQRVCIPKEICGMY
jgi:hypothetical protein